MDNVKWLFFDIGSTLVDENECCKSRIDFAVNSKNLIERNFYPRFMRLPKSVPLQLKRQQPTTMLTYPSGITS